MGLKIFFTYIGSLLVLSALLIVFAKKLADGFAKQGKKPIFYGIFSSLIASAAAFLAAQITNNLFTVFWMFAAVLIIFGIIHVRMVHKKYFSSTSQDKVKVFIGELFFAMSIVLFVIFVFSSLQYFMKNDREFIFYPMMLSTLAFFIPTLVYYTFESAYSIPAAIYPTWEYPLDNPIELPEEDPREKLLVIGFEIAKRTNDYKKTYFRAKAPDGIKLGELFYHFINDYNELQSETPIDYQVTGVATEWWFHLKSKWFMPRKILDPYLTVRENGIKENSVIICERIPVST
jgi:hypothetical protein